MSNSPSRLNNLCLDIPLAPVSAPPPPINYRKVLGVDPGAKDGSRVATASYAYLPPADLWGSVDMNALLKQYRSQMSSILSSQFNSLHHLRSPFAPDEHRPRAEDLGCVEALIRALRDQGDYDEVAMDAQVSDWRRSAPQYLNAWLFGPRGEFTGFARVAAVDDRVKRCALNGLRRGGEATITLEGYPLKVNFKVTMVSGLDDSANWRSRISGRPDFEAYCRFANYADYAAWEDLARCDRTDLNVI